LETSEGSFLSGVHYAKDIVRHLQGQARKQRLESEMKRKCESAGLGRVKVGKIGDTVVYVRHAIKSGDFLGASRLGKATFDYDAKGKEWPVESDSETDSESDN